MSRKLILIIWEFGIAFLREFGRENNLCADIQIVKRAKVFIASEMSGEVAGVSRYDG